MGKFALAVLSMILLATSASALELRDKNNVRIGTLVNHEPYFGYKFQSTALATHNGLPYVVYVGRAEITGTHWLHFATPDCTGTPVLPLSPAERTEIIAHLTGVTPDGEFWMMHRIRMYEQLTQSYWIDAGGDAGGDAHTCKRTPGYTYWVTPMIRIGNLNTKFAPPYTIK